MKYAMSRIQSMMTFYNRQFIITDHIKAAKSVPANKHKQH